MTSTHVEPTPGPYILSASPISLAGYKHMGARGVPCVVEVEMRWISMNEHDATNILFAYAEPLLQAGRGIVSSADDDMAPEDFSSAMAKLIAIVDALEDKLSARRGRPIEPVAGPYSVAPVHKDRTIILSAPGAPVLARVDGRFVTAAVQIANAVLFTKAPELLKAARLLVEGERNDDADAHSTGLDLMRSTVRIIGKAIQVL
jgi:hypothetical protein